MAREKTADERIEEVLNDLTDRYAQERRDKFDSYLLDAMIDDASPIEKLMTMGLIYAISSESWFGGDGGENQFFYGVPSHTLAEHLVSNVSGPGIHIHPEVPVGRYRADFLVRFAHWRGGIVFGAIECDGHDHHNLTKEQALHDRERDREFQKQGLIILRYTGSEIWKSPLKAASNALAILEQRASEESAPRWDLPAK